MKKYLILTLAALAALVSCQKENLQNSAVSNEPLVFTASIAQDDTKTTLDMSTNPAKVLWEATDKITISDGSHKAVYKVSSGSGTKTATFVKDSGADLDYPGTYTATYGATPAKSQYCSSAGSVPLHMTAPSTSSTDGLCFTADCGVLCVTLTDASHTIMRIEVSDGTNTYKVTAPSGVVKPSAEKFYLVLPAGTYTSLNIYDNVNQVCTKAITWEITAGHIRPASNSSALTFGACTTKGFDGIHAWAQLWTDGPKWAETNVGATKPEDYGDYYAWGATTTQTTYDWANAPFNGGNSDYSSTAWESSKSGAVDSYNNLLLAKDVARAKWGSNWRMPTGDELSKLLTECTCDWTENNDGTGVAGRIVKSTNGNSIFLPAAGFFDNSTLNNDGVYGNYWSSSLEADYRFSSIVQFYYSKMKLAYGYRYFGLSVRPVRP